MASIRAQLPNLNTGEDVKAIYSRIARTRRLPRSSSLDAIPGWTTAAGNSYTVWWINLNVMTGKNTGYALRFRENNHPAAKPKGEAVLARADIGWIREDPKSLAQ